MSELKSKIKATMIDSMKAKQPERTQGLRMILAAIQKKEIETRVEPLDNASVEKVLLTMGKQLQESMDQARGAGRMDLVGPLENEALLLKEFLPKQFSVEEVTREVTQIVAELKSAGTLPAGPAAMGAVMKAVMAKIGSKAEGKVIQSAVKTVLG